MAKVYNKKKGMYKGSLPGMRMGGTLRKAQTGDQGILPPMDGPPNRMSGEEQLIRQIETRKKEIENLMDQEVRNDYINANISDSLYRDHQLKNELKSLNTEFDDLNSINNFQKLEAACMRGDAAACAQLKAEGLSKDDILTRNLHRHSNLSDYYNQMEPDERKIMEEEGFSPTQSKSGRYARKINPDEIQNVVPNINYKKGGVVKKKRGGTILGGKYKMKKGGSVGRNGIL